MHTTKLFNKQLLIGMIAGVFVAGLIGIASYLSVSKSGWLPINEIEAKSAEFVDSELLQGKGSSAVKVIGKEGNLYKLEVSVNGQKINSFISKDGNTFFPQAFEINANADKGDIQTKTQPAAEQISKKSDKPTVELFVMSHCPYGTQIEKGILPVINTLGDKINFNLKFVDYAMHGEKELKEQLNQYCIQKEQPAKFLTYLECFLKDGDGGAENCISQLGVDKVKMGNCVANADKEYKVLENFNNKVGFKGNSPGFEIFKSDNEKYGVQGSPTLIVNGVQSQSGRDSKSLLKSVCSAFNNPPKECSTELSGETPAPGFGGGVAPSGSDSGGCH